MNSKPITSSAVAHGGTTETDNLILLCPRHHKLLHDHGIRTSGTGEHPTFEGQPDARSPPTSHMRRLPRRDCEERA